MELHRATVTPQNSMEKFPLESVKLHGTISMELHGIPCPNTPWKSMELHGKFSIEFHGVPWNSMGLFYTGCYARIKSSRFLFFRFVNSGKCLIRNLNNVFHSFTRNSNYSRPKECCFFHSVSCVFLLHMPVCLLPIC